MATKIKTRILIISDTHGEALIHKPAGNFDVAIHCGDMTEESKLPEYHAALQLLKEISAPLKLVIAGNHDIALDTPTLKRMLRDNTTSEDMALVQKTYGSFSEARALFDSEEARAAGIVFLDEGTHRFTLDNGAALSVFASPYTTSSDASWAFQYLPADDHTWAIEDNTDIVITHSPPHGVLDYTNRKRTGSASLFAAVARARSRLHCFGHVHSAWGARVVAWRETLSETPSHFTDIDNERSHTVESLATLRPKKFDSAEILAEKEAKLRVYDGQGCVETREVLGEDQTLFVNAAIEGPEDGVQQHPWVVEINLPRAGG